MKMINNFSLKLILTLFVLIIYSGNPSAFEGLIPGESSRGEVYKILGEPIEIIYKNGIEIYLFDPAPYQGKRIQGLFDKSGVLKSLALEPLESYSKEQYEKWFGLSKPTGYREQDGLRITEYANEEYELVHENLAPDSLVQGYVHVSISNAPAVVQKTHPKTESRKTLVGQKKTTPVTPATNTTNYLGLNYVLTRKGGVFIVRVHPDSPAQDAGLQVEDVLLQLGQTSLRAPVRDRSVLVNAIQSLQPGQTHPVLFKRNGKEKKSELQIVALSETELKERKGVGKEQAKLAKEYHQKGKKLASAKEWKKAIAQYERAYALDASPRNHAVDLANAYRKQRRFADAERILLKRASFDEANLVYYYLGRTKMEQKKYNKAIDYFHKSYSLRGKNDDGYYDLYRLGLAYFGDKQPVNAERQFKKALSLRDKYDDVHYWLGRSAEMQKHWQDAKNLYQAYLKLKPDNQALVKDAKKRSEQVAQTIKQNDPNYQIGRKVGESIGDSLKGLIFGAGK